MGWKTVSVWSGYVPDPHSLGIRTSDCVLAAKSEVSLTERAVCLV